MEIPEAITRNLTSTLAGSTTPNLARLLWRHRGSVDNWTKAMSLLAFTAVLAPARWTETIATSGQIRRHSLGESPFFVLGHPRSGTTHLFRLLAHDPQYSFLRVRQNVFPSMCATGRPISDFLLAGLGPDERPMDGMPISASEPDEEDGGVGNLTGQFVGGLFFFPRHARQFFDKWALMRGVSPDESTRWITTYEALLTKASFLDGGRRMITKDPWNTARIPQLLGRWPDAPILHVVRHPCAVYLSAFSALREATPLVRFCEVSDDDMRDLLFDMYRELLTAHLAQRASVPTGQYAEIRYEDLVTDPVGELRRVYAQLGLDGWAAFEPHLLAYVQEVADYRPNRFVLEADLARRIAEEWHFAFDEWGYDPADMIDATAG